MHCLRCGTENQKTSKFCSNCGAPLAFDALVQSTVRDQLDDTLNARLKDNKVVVVEIADALKERVLSWAKLVGLPITALLSILAIFGIKSVNDLWHYKTQLDSMIDKGQQNAAILETQNAQSLKQAEDLRQHLEKEIAGVRLLEASNRDELAALRARLCALEVEGQKPPLGPGKAPYHLPLAKVIGDARTAEIEQAGKLVFQVTGNTGGARNPLPQQIVADAMRKAIVAEHDSEAPAFLYLLGNITFYQGQTQNYYEQFYKPYAKYPAEILAIPGNHDGDTRMIRGDPPPPSVPLEGFMRTFTTATRTQQPESRDSGRRSMIQPNSYWTLTTPLATIIGLYTNVPEGGALDEAQRKWLVAEMRNAPTDRALIVALHHSPFLVTPRITASRCPAGDLQDAINKTRRVPNMILSATAMLYQRIDVTVAPGLTVPFFVIGSGGYWRLVRGVSKLKVGEGDDQRHLQASINDRHGFVTLEITRSSIAGRFTVAEQPKDGAAPVIETADTFAYSAKPLMLGEGQYVDWTPSEPIMEEADQQADQQ